MVWLDPWIFLHPATYHDGGIAVLPIVVLTVGVALFGFGAWQLLTAAPARSAEAGDEPADASAEQ